MVSLPTVLAVDWVVISNVAVAVGTLVLAVFTWLGLRKADRAIRVSEANAQAAKMAADAAKESASIAREQLFEEQRALYAATAPRLRIKDRLEDTQYEPGRYRTSLVNQGNSAAIDLSLRIVTADGQLLVERSLSGPIRPHGKQVGAGYEVAFDRPEGLVSELVLDARYES